MDGDDPHDIAAQQAAAQNYQAAHDSALVGLKLPCENITEEYAKADPVYVEKTLALPQSYSHYRPIRGDGNCGWRAIGFSYFEKLAESGNREKIEGEFTRLTSYNQLLESIGGFNGYWEDFAEAALDLLTELAAQSVDTMASLALVYERWNDENTTNSIIYYLRLLAATYLKEHRAQYEPFVDDGSGVDGYCDGVILPVNREIDHLGITSLANVLLQPIGAMLDIAYLDRSEGPTVNHHQCPEAFVDLGAAHLGPIIYLLYRPDHYDILYRLTTPVDVAAPPNDLVYQVNHVAVLPPNISLDNAASMGGVQDLSGVDFDLLGNMLPNFFSVTDSSMASHPVHGSTPTSFTTRPTAWADHYDEGLGASPPSAMPPSMAGISSNPSTPMTPASTATTTGSGNVPTGAGQLGNRGPSSADCQIRFSNAQYDYDEISDQFKVQTSTFKNSVYNTAHYRNPNFHPEECRPDGEPFERRSSTKKKKRQDA